MMSKGAWREKRAVAVAEGLALAVKRQRCQSIEAAHHKAIVAWFNMRYPLLQPFLIHIPNEGLRSQVTGNQLNQLGMKAGVLDLMLAIPNGYYAGLWLEVKKPGQMPTKDQEDYIFYLRAAGYYANWVDNSLEGQKTIEYYLNQPNSGRLWDKVQELMKTVKERFEEALKRKHFEKAEKRRKSIEKKIAIHLKEKKEC